MAVATVPDIMHLRPDCLAQPQYLSKITIPRDTRQARLIDALLCQRHQTRAGRAVSLQQLSIDAAQYRYILISSRGGGPKGLCTKQTECAPHRVRPLRPLSVYVGVRMYGGTS